MNSVVNIGKFRCPTLDVIVVILQIGSVPKIISTLMSNFIIKSDGMSGDNSPTWFRNSSRIRKLRLKIVPSLPQPRQARSCTARSLCQSANQQHSPLLNHYNKTNYVLFCPKLCSDGYLYEVERAKSRESSCFPRYEPGVCEGKWFQ